MHRIHFPLRIALASALTIGTAQAQSRYAGTGSLSKPEKLTSSDQRYSLRAELQAGSPRVSSDGRFALRAHLQLPPEGSKSIAACGPVIDAVFNNGFE